MVIKTIDQKISRAFSDAAIQYDVLTSLHKEIGRELVNKVKDIPDPTHILDVGMGTGWLTNRLTNFFPDAAVIGLDFAPGMIEIAKKYNEGFTIIQADATALPFHPGTIDLVISNLAYQWVPDFPMAMKQAWAALKPGGIICFNMFGYQTLEELFISLDRSLKDEKIALPIRRLPSRQQVIYALEAAGFRGIEGNYEHIKVHFPDMMSLIKWIKNIGANAMERDLYVGKELLARADEYYNNHFRDRHGVCATFEVIWASAKKS